MPGDADQLGTKTLRLPDLSQRLHAESLRFIARRDHKGRVRIDRHNRHPRERGLTIDADGPPLVRRHAPQFETPRQLGRGRKERRRRAAAEWHLEGDRPALPHEPEIDVLHADLDVSTKQFAAGRNDLRVGGVETDRSHQDVACTRETGGEDDALPVGGDPRLILDAGIARQRPAAAAVTVRDPDVPGALSGRAVDDAAVRRPVDAGAPLHPVARLDDRVGPYGVAVGDDPQTRPHVIANRDERPAVRIGGHAGIRRDILGDLPEPARGITEGPDLPGPIPPPAVSLVRIENDRAAISEPGDLSALVEPGLAENLFRSSLRVDHHHPVAMSRHRPGKCGDASAVRRPRDLRRRIRVGLRSRPEESLRRTVRIRDDDDPIAIGCAPDERHPCAVHRKRGRRGHVVHDAARRHAAQDRELEKTGRTVGRREHVEHALAIGRERESRIETGRRRHDLHAARRRHLSHPQRRSVEPAIVVDDVAAVRREGGDSRVAGVSQAADRLDRRERR